VLALTVDKHTIHTTTLLKAVAATEGDLAAQGGVHLRHPSRIEGVGAEGIRQLGAIEDYRAVGGTLAEIGETAVAIHQVVDAAQHTMDGHRLLGILPIFNHEIAGAQGSPLKHPPLGSGRQVKDEEITEDNVYFLVRVFWVTQVVVPGDVLTVTRIRREIQRIAVVARVLGLDREGLGRHRRWGGEGNGPREGCDDCGKNSHRSLGRREAQHGHGEPNFTKEPG